MFTWSVRVVCKYPACRQELVKYQTCLIFLRPLPTLVSYPNFSHLATGLSVNLTACRLHFSANQTGLSVTSIRLVPNMDFPTVLDDKQTMREGYSTVTVQWVTLAGLSVAVPDRPVKFTGQSVAFTDWIPESGKFVTDRP